MLQQFLSSSCHTLDEELYYAAKSSVLGFSQNLKNVMGALYKPTFVLTGV